MNFDQQQVRVSVTPLQIPKLKKKLHPNNCKSNKLWQHSTSNADKSERGIRTVGDDGAGLRRDFELLSGKFKHHSEGSRLGDAETGSKSTN